MIKKKILKINLDGVNFCIKKFIKQILLARLIETTRFLVTSQNNLLRGLPIPLLKKPRKIECDYLKI